MAAPRPQDFASTPVPDPTVLTTQALLREIDALKELTGARLDAATGLTVERFATLNQRFETFTERFNSVQTQFKERDVRVEQTAKETKVAVDAALQAAEKAVGKQNEASSLSIAKSEAATNKQIDQLGELIKTNAQASSDKMDDLKERILRLEGEDRGSKAVGAQRQQSSQSSVAMASLVLFGVLSFAGLLVAVAAIIWKHG